MNQGYKKGFYPLSKYKSLIEITLVYDLAASCDAATYVAACRRKRHSRCYWKQNPEKQRWHVASSSGYRGMKEEDAALTGPAAGAIEASAPLPWLKNVLPLLLLLLPCFAVSMLHFFYYFVMNERKSIRSLNRFTLWAHREGAGMGGKDSYAQMHQHSPWVCNKLMIHLKIKSWPPVNKASYTKFQHKQTLIEQVWSSG